MFNLDDHPADMLLELTDFYLDTRGEYFAHSFWDQKLYRIREAHTFTGIPEHSARVLALYPVSRRAPQYLGGSLHISQGQEVPRPRSHLCAPNRTAAPWEY